MPATAVMPDSPDIIVIGAGIAGTSAAAELAASARVLLLEMETQPGYHATGRSAAFFTPAYGNASVRAVTALSEPFYRSPPPGFSEVELLRPRDCLFFAHDGQLDALNALQKEVGILKKLSADEVREKVSVFSTDYLAGGMLDDTGGDLDVDAVLQGYLRLFLLRGGELVTGTVVNNLVRDDGIWQVHAGGRSYTAPVIVNAAGAWADEVAELAGLAPLGLQPMRRTVMIIDAPDGVDISDWPLAINVEEEFYFKPDAGALLLSLANETPSPPCDSRPEDIEVAMAVDRFEMATGMEVPRVTHRWAGLRTFAPDKIFVLGFDPRSEGFFWLAGQGGYGVQTAPGLAWLTAAVINNTATPTDLDPAVFTQLKPDRLIGEAA